MLGGAERAAGSARTVTAVAGPRLLAAVRGRLYDDGAPAPAEDARLEEHVAARAREAAALASDPALIARQVRGAMRDVTDPGAIAAAVAFRQRQIAYLNKASPKDPPPSPFRAKPWTPDRPAAVDFARRYAVAMDPIQALEQVEQRSLTPEAAEAFREVYPLLFEQTRARLLSRAAEIQKAPDRDMRLRMSILFQVPLDSSLEPESLARLQEVYATSAQPAPGPASAGPPAPAIAGPVDLGSMYDETRRAR
jgi:hypothetical protein